MGAGTHNSKGLETTQRIVNPPGQRLFDLKSAARYLGRSTWGVRELIWRGELPFIRSGAGGKMYVDVRDIDEFIMHEKTTMV